MLSLSFPYHLNPWTGLPAFRKVSDTSPGEQYRAIEHLLTLPLHHQSKPLNWFACFQEGFWYSTWWAIPRYWASAHSTSTSPIGTLELVCLLSGRFLILHLVSNTALLSICSLYLYITNRNLPQEVSLKLVENNKTLYGTNFKRQIQIYLSSLFDLWQC